VSRSATTSTPRGATSVTQFSRSASSIEK
jgi:hypothetical protein